MMKVAVIGAGAAGLCCARHLSRYPEYFQVQVLEQTQQLGGTWVYTAGTSSSQESSPREDLHVHSSVYKNLRTNLPKEIMYFPGFPFPSNLRSFPDHSDVLKYLQHYASHYELDQCIRFGSVVEQVVPVPVHTFSGQELIPPHDNGQVTFKDSVRWNIIIRDVKSRQRISESYDAVLVCNGHFSDPRTPDIPGLSKFPGSVIHSHLYREPEPYSNQTVMVVGVGQSGLDIMLDLSPYVKQVYLCNRGPPLIASIPENVEELPAIYQVKDDGKVHFTNSEERQVDSIILATGYHYSFPFLTEEAGINVLNGKRVTPLYKHTFNPVHPSMAVIGINFGYNPFPFFDYQVQWVLSVWAGYKTLPSLVDMIKDDEDYYEKRLQQGLSPQKVGHFLGSAQWEAIDMLAKLGGIESLPPVFEMLYVEVHHERRHQLMHYKNNDYTVLDKEKWALTKPI